MGSGVSDLRGISASVVHAEVMKEFARAQAHIHDRSASGVVKEEHVDKVINAFQAVEQAVEIYEAAYKERLKEDEETGKTSLVELADDVNSAYQAYKLISLTFTFQVGDLVRVRDPEFGVFVEGNILEILRDVHGSGQHDLRVQLSEETPEEDSSYDKRPSLAAITVPLDSGVAKVRCWSFLEVGDSVRTKVDGLSIVAKVVEVDDDVGEVRIDTGGDMDEEWAEEFPNEDDDKGRFITLPFDQVQKIQTKRLAHLRFADAVNKVKKTLYGVKMFQLAGKMPNEESKDANERSSDHEASE